MKILISAFLFSTYIMSCTPSQQSQDQTKPQTIQLKPAKANSFAKLNNSVFLDVRTPEEFNQGHIDQSIHINFYDSDFEEQLIKLDKSKSYIVYCKSGMRSNKATKLMTKLGFKNTANLLGGYMAWK